jgi:hypothetical protein
MRSNALRNHRLMILLNEWSNGRYTGNPSTSRPAGKRCEHRGPVHSPINDRLGKQDLSTLADSSEIAVFSQKERTYFWRLCTGIGVCSLSALVELPSRREPRSIEVRREITTRIRRGCCFLDGCPAENSVGVEVELRWNYIPEVMRELLSPLLYSLSCGLRTRTRPHLEIIVLRHQLGVLQRKGSHAPPIYGD